MQRGFYSQLPQKFPWDQRLYSEASARLLILPVLCCCRGKIRGGKGWGQDWCSFLCAVNRQEGKERGSSQLSHWLTHNLLTIFSVTKYAHAEKQLGPHTLPLKHEGVRMIFDSMHPPVMTDSWRHNLFCGNTTQVPFIYSTIQKTVQELANITKMCTVSPDFTEQHNKQQFWANTQASHLLILRLCLHRFSSSVQTFVSTSIQRQSALPKDDSQKLPFFYNQTRAGLSIKPVCFFLTMLLWMWPRRSSEEAEP